MLSVWLPGGINEAGAVRLVQDRFKYDLPDGIDLKLPAGMEGGRIYFHPTKVTKEMIVDITVDYK